MAKLAPRKPSERHIDFNPALLSLRFDVDSATAASSSASSSQPINEPFVDMLLELTWNNGRLVREYTFLLDPADLRAAQSAQVAAGEWRRPRVRAGAPRRGSRPQPGAATPRRRRRRRAAAAPQPRSRRKRPPPNTASSQATT